MPPEAAPLSRAARPASGWPLLRRAAWERRGELAAGSAAGIAWQAAAWLTPLAVAAAIDRGVVAGDGRALLSWTLVLAGLAVLEAATTLTRHRFACIPAARALIATRGRLHGDALALDDRARRGLPPGEVIARATSDAEWIEEAVDYVPSTVSRAVTIVAVAAILPAIDASLAAVVLAPLPLVALLAWRSSVRYTRRSDALQADVGAAAELAESAIAGARAIAGLGAGPAMTGRWRRLARSVRERALAVARLDAAYGPAVQAVVAASLVAALWLGGRRVIDGELGVGALVAVIAYVIILTAPLEQMGEVIAVARRAEASAARLAEVAARAAASAPDGGEALAPSGAGPLPVRAEGLRVERPSGPPALDGVDLEVPAGAVVAVVGATGAGTSTLARALAGLLRPDAGRVLVGGVDVAALRPDARAATVQLVGADEFLHSGPAGAVVAFGRPEAGAGEVEAAVAAAGAADVLDGMESGLRTDLGERGRRLSGGQRQRMALARALLLRPRALVLDDATSALDPALEVEVLQRLADRDRTLVVVTRRAEVAAMADRVVLLERGRVVAEGPPDRLAAHPGYRAALALDGGREAR